jgi:hypothetical protein
MGILGALPGDIAACIYGHDQDACERVYWGYYLWPRLQRLLEELELLAHPPLPIPPGPDPSVSLLQELASVLIAPHLVGPNPEPALPLELRLQVTIKFRDGLLRHVEQLNKEIGQLESMLKAR